MSGSLDPFSDDDDLSFDKIFSDDDLTAETTQPKLQSKDTSRLGFGRKSRSGVPIPIVSSALTWIFKTVSTSEASSINHPRLRAMHNEIEIATDTHVDLLATHYRLESQLVHLHRQLRFANVATLALQEISDAGEELSRLSLYINCWIDFLNYSLEITKSQYLEFGDRHGLKIYPSVVEFGKYPYVTPEMDVFGGSAPGLAHYLYGDISQLPDHHQDIFEMLFTIVIDQISKEGQLDSVFSDDSSEIHS